MKMGMVMSQWQKHSTKHQAMIISRSRNMMIMETQSAMLILFLMVEMVF